MSFFVSELFQWQRINTDKDIDNWWSHTWAGADFGRGGGDEGRLLYCRGAS